MAKIKYQGRDNAPAAVDPGEYVVEVIGYEFKQTPNTGNDYARMKYREGKSGATIYDSLYFTEKAEWRIDTFLRASGLAPKLGEELDFNEEFCERKAIGARLWVSVSKVEKENKPGQFYNEVVAYVTSKPVPARAPKIDPKDVPPANPAVAQDW